MPTGVQFGIFPMLPSEQIRHIKGIIVRKAVGKGDKRFKRYLALTKRKLPYEYRIDEWGDSSEEEDEVKDEVKVDDEVEDEDEYDCDLHGEEDAAPADTKALTPEEEKLEKQKVYLDKECKICQ